MAHDEHKVLIPANPAVAQSKPVPNADSSGVASGPTSAVSDTPAHIPGLMPEMPKPVPVAANAQAKQPQSSKPAQTGPAPNPSHDQRKNRDEDEERGGIGGKISDFIKQSERVLAVTHKPGEAEYKRIALSTALGITLLGVTGILASILGSLVRH